ncbi:hypothetical protein [Streptomyces sp. NPDC049555]|uniref:hypothetical protein n=1 Tax=unclassified Streptomyces TaxID=2593676 RepID=UPI0034354658
MSSHTPEYAPRVPSTPEEAVAVARGYCPATWPDGSPMGLAVHEFDEGYLVYATGAPEPDPTRPPENLGGSHVVIAKDDGQVSFVPSFPFEQAIELYRTHYRPREGR